MSDSFSEDEARRIFARAAERQHAAGDDAPGLSMAELEEIGRASGLDPAHVAAAAAEVRAGTAARPADTFLGVDVEPRATRVIPAEMTDELWERTVARLRRTFGSRGAPTDVGRLREWTSGPTSNLHLTAEPVQGGTRVTIETSKAQDARGYRIVSPIFLAMTVFFAVLGLVQGEAADGGFWVFMALWTLFVVGLPLGGRVALAQWANRRQDQFAALLDQIELDARTLAAPLAETPRQRETGAEPRGRIDLDALDEPDDARSRERPGASRRARG